MRHSLKRYQQILHSLFASSVRRVALMVLLLGLSGATVYFIVHADTSPQTLPFSQNWTNTGLITANDNWAGVPGIEGYLGQDITTATGTDPQTLLGTSSVAGDLTVLANQTATTITNGDVAEFHTTSQAGAPGTNPTIALQGSGTADAPYILLYLNTTGQTGISIAYNLRDIDCTTDNAVQPVALQYRIGNSGNFTNVPAGFVADATTGPSLCTQVTAMNVALPAAVENQPLVQVRIITTNAVGNDEWVGVDDISVTTGPVVDTAPSVATTNPADNATGVPVASNISVTFSEAVNAPAAAFSISCSLSGAHTFALSGGPTTFTLNPDTDFSQNEVCTVTVAAAQVTDVDVIDPPDNMAADFVFDFTTVNLGSCGGAFTPIYTIQGSGTASPSVGASVTTEGIVVGDFQGANNLKGFYIQDPTGDANTATSDGIYVFDGDTPGVDVAVGDRVRITGTVSESFNNTQINPASSIIVCSTGNSLPPATAVDLPEPVNNDLERYENMLVVFPETLTVTGNFSLGRFGELVLSSDGRLFQQNNFDRTNSAGALAVAESNPRRYVLLDDGLSIQNPDPTPYFDGNNTRRVGDTTTGLQGVLTFDFSEYRVQPTTPPVFVSANPRTAAPASVGGNVKVSSFNVLNYFNGNGAGGGFPTSRGATSLAEFNRQRDKIIAAILAINADVYGVIEIENDGNTATSAIQDLVNGLNAATAAGTYAFREGTTPGTDEIKNSIIYKTTTVTPDGAAVNDTDTIWTGQARNPLAQTFTLNSNSQKFVFIVNHFTSKGCSASDTGGDADQGDGQGCDNLQRTLQAEALLDFIEERQNASGTARVLVMGDLNSYGEEDPIFRLENDAMDRLMDGPGGLIDQVQRFVPVANRYSYQFGNQSGYLDHALATKELDSFVSGTTIWHINADEPTVLDYNVENKSPAQQAINVGSPYRASDHDPVIVGLNLVCPTIAVTPTSVPTGTAGSPYGPVNFMQMNGAGTITWSVSSNNLPAGLILNSMTGVLDGTPTVAAGVNVTVRATDSNGCFGEVIVTLQINCPTITISPSSGSPTVLTSGTVGQSYSQTFTAAPAGGGYSYSIPGPAIPPGLMFNTATGVLSGTPTTQGTFFFTVTATGFGTCAGTQDYSLTINAGCPSSFTVNDLGDAPDQTPGDFLCQAASGACTLRAAIMEANAIPACTPLTINFSVTGTINLATALPALNHPNLTINGPGANQLDVHRNAVAAFRIFTINGGRTVAISGLSVTNGNDPVQAGGIYNAGTLTLTACAISGNTSPQGGGIQSDNILTMTGCTVNNNIASDFAGGLKIFGPTTTLTNCTFSNNQANDSSAIESGTGATLTLTNCTIANNQAGSGAGQTGSALFANSGTVLKNTIVANNSGNNANIAGPVDTANSFNNLIGAVGTGGLTNGVNGNQVGVANANTLLAALGNYGGTTQTIALLPGSPAINAGTASGAPATDQRGIARPQLGTVDIGAFESRGFTLALAGGNNQSAFVNTAFANPLAVSVTANSAGEPVNGGKVTFTPPGSGASATIAGNPVTIAGGVANGNATANGVVGGPYTVAASANGATPAINFSLTNTNPPPTIVAGAALTRQQGSAASNSPIATVSDPNQTAGTLTVTATTVPAGLTVMNIVNTNGTITADVAASCLATLGANTIVLTVTDSFGATATANLTVNVTANTAPSLVYATPQNVTAGNSLNVSPTTATDNGSITGYSIVSVTPALSTAPTVNASGMVAITNAGPSGSHVITVRATDNCNATTDASFTLNVNCQTITVTAPATNTGTISTAFSQTFTQSGGIGTITWSETGALPAGITLNSSTGVLSGTPTATGTFPITVKATDTNGCMGTVNYTLTISCPIFTINPPTLPNATVGTHYIETISAVAANGITLTGGNLPPGMQLILFQPGQSVLTGTPTAPGTFTFTVTATGFGGCTGQRDFTLVVQGGAAPPLTARIDDPLVCTGPGNTVSVTATVTNTNGTAQPASFTATLTPTLRALPGTCTANVGTCSVVNASTVTWVGTLAANQTVTINYQAQVNDGVLPGTQLCATSVATVGSSLPATVTACSVVNCPVIGPGALPAATSPISDQKAGSVLIFNVYTSSTNPIQQNTRVSITNINPTLPAFVHLFLVDGASCSVADSILCLTANQTTTFLASDLDPGTTGYIIAVAVDGNGCPTNFNYLIGDEYVKFSTGHAANLGAEAITAIAGGLPLCDTNSTTATLAFDGISYNLVPHVLAADNIGSRADGNDTLLILNRIGGNLATGASTLGTIFGLFYDDSERGVSFNLAAGACQFRNSITNTLPRITPRFDQFVPAGRTGWFKVWVPGLFGMTGAILNTNPNAGTSAGAFDQGHNLHKLTLTSTASYTIPIFPPGC